MTIALKTFLESYLGKTGSALGWSAIAGDYDFIVELTLSVYGVATEGDATNLNKLYAIAKVEAWKAVLANVSAFYNFSADGGNFSRSQIYEMAEKNLALCLSEAFQYYSSGSIEIGEFTTEENPYTDYPPYYERYK